MVNSELGIRASYLKSAVKLASDLIERKVPTILFGPSRNSVEIMLKYLRDKLAGVVPPAALMAYRGGYLPDTRRQIESDLRDGEILGVVATNALELGIDIGSLDAVVCAGYPGSVAAMWQRFGRAGRRGGGSVAVLVTSSAPLDQYLAGDPETLLGAPIEEARIDPDNVEIVVQHLKCAAFELPFSCARRRGGDRGLCRAPRRDDTRERASLPRAPRRGARVEGRFHWSADAYPANHVSLRSIGWDNFVIIDQDKRHGHRRARLARDAHDAARAGHLPARRRAVPGRAARLREPQGLRQQGRARLLHHGDDEPRGLGHRRERVARRSGRCTLAWGEVSSSRR